MSKFSMGISESEILDAIEDKYGEDGYTITHVEIKVEMEFHNPHHAPEQVVTAVIYYETEKP